MISWPASLLTDQPHTRIWETKAQRNANEGRRCTKEPGDKELDGQEIRAGRDEKREKGGGGAPLHVGGPPKLGGDEDAGRRGDTVGDLDLGHLLAQLPLDVVAQNSVLLLGLLLLLL